MLLAQAIDLVVGRRRRHPDLVRDDDPFEPAPCEGRVQHVAAARADRCAAHQRKRYIGAELRGEIVQFARRQARAPQGVAGDERGRRVGGSASHAPRDGDLLADVEVHPSAVPGRSLQQPSGTQREIRLVDGDADEVDGTGERERELVGVGRDHVLE